MPDTARRTDRWIDRISPLWFAAGAGLVACLVTLYFFCPRFYVWRGLELVADLPPDSEFFQFVSTHPEINRAVAVAQQLKNPDIKIRSSSNSVVNRQTLFPRMGHAFGLSRTAFMSLTFVGCWAAAALIAAVMSRQLGDRVQAFWATLLACPSAWFFTSTSWLTYNDSWVVLGLVAVTFVRSRWALAAACFLECWIDDRFLLALPTALALRTFVHPRDAAWLRTFAYDVLTAATAAAPYLLARISAYYNGTDVHTAEDLAARAAEPVSLFRYLEGAWAGLRCNWLFVGVWAWLAARTQPRWWAAVAITGTLISVLVCLKSAGDLHRSAAMFVVVALAGIAMLHQVRPALCAKALPVIALVSLALPASHVITAFKVPIYGAMVEWDRSHTALPANLTPEFYFDRGLRSANEKKLDRALFYFDYALKIDPTFRPATFYKTVAMADMGRNQEAVAVLDSALRDRPDWPEAYYMRGRCRERLGDVPGALDDFEQAVRQAPAESKVKGEAEHAVERLRGPKPTP
jgi:tetratricopeptide (TPR) repeat protein